MALTQTIWSLDDKAPLPAANLKSEKELEDLLAEHIEILNADWLLIGRQVRTVVGKYIDLLCMDHEGDLIVVELKRDLTPREVTAQAIDYASCVADMKLEEFADLYLHTSNGALTLNDAYQKKFGRPLDEESINQNVKMVIVAAKMDDSTERIIRYLREKYEVTYFPAANSDLSAVSGLTKMLRNKSQQQIPFVLGTKNTMYRLV